MHGVPQLGIRWNTYTCSFLCYFRAHTTECRALYYYAVVRMLGECSRAQGIAFTLKHIHGIKFIILCYRIIVRGIFHNIYGSKKKKTDVYSGGGMSLRVKTMPSRYVHISVKTLIQCIKRPKECPT